MQPNGQDSRPTDTVLGRLRNRAWAIGRACGDGLYRRLDRGARSSATLCRPRCGRRGEVALPFMRVAASGPSPRSPCGRRVSPRRGVDRANRLGSWLEPPGAHRIECRPELQPCSWWGLALLPVVDARYVVLTALACSFLQGERRQRRTSHTSAAPGPRRGAGRPDCPSLYHQAHYLQWMLALKDASSKPDKAGDEALRWTS